MCDQILHRLYRLGLQKSARRPECATSVSTWDSLVVDNVSAQTGVCDIVRDIRQRVDTNMRLYMMNCSPMTRM
jgi:hypothetical protein